MHLEKFYLDIITATGKGAIGYHANASWGLFKLRPSSLLTWSQDTAVAPERRFRLRGTSPEIGPHEIQWNERAFNVSSQWIQDAPSDKEYVLWESKQVSVRWQLLAAPARVSWQHENHVLQGYGYAERLKIEGNPLRLPIKRLHWGRFISSARHITWIAWEHSDGNQRWLWHQQDAPLRNFSIQQDRISWNGYHLQLVPQRTLRTGKIGQTVLQPLKLLKPLLPSWIRRLDETKWLSEGTLYGPEGIEDSGWVIHEIVHFH